MMSVVTGFIANLKLFFLKLAIEPVEIQFPFCQLLTYLVHQSQRRIQNAVKYLR